MNPVKTLNRYGQSVWLDYIRRGLLDGGGLQRLISEDGVSGLTSNPSIFQKAIAGSNDYIPVIRALSQNRSLDTEAIYEQLAVEDLRQAADLLQPVYARSGTRDGYVSLEVSPRLARDTEGTLAAARHLWYAVDRANLMIKVPGTPEGLPAIEELIAEGINVNVTLLFSLRVYEQVAERYLRGLERRRVAGHDLQHSASVASFFLSRIDTLVDGVLEQRLGMHPTAAQRAQIEAVRGRTAVASARLAYQRWKTLFSGERWESLREAGARPQRLLWASTSTKNPTYPDLMYVESLIGPETVNTLPPATLDALRDHGRPRPTLEEGVEGAMDTLENLQRLEIDLKQLTQRLQEDGLAQFNTAYDRLLEAVDEARKQVMATPPDRQELHLPDELMEPLHRRLETWRQERGSERLWSRDASLWSGQGENHWLDWLDIVHAQLGRLADLRRVGHLTEGHYFHHAVLLGMGGSSLAPEVLSRVFGHGPEHPELLVLDSTDPDQIRGVQERLDLERTLFIIASKSGSTLEPKLLGEYFFALMSDRIGEARARRHFFAITDAGSPLETYAKTHGFRQVFYGRPGIGGRYSALSDFGMVPAALLGMNLERFLERSAVMVETCSAVTPAAQNPAVVLGVLLGVAREQGWDKVTFVATPRIEPLTGWLEQLLAESTGKQGTGLIPVQGEKLAAPARYDQDRLFVYLRLSPEADPQQDAAVARLADAGFPVVRIEIGDIYDLGQEFFRWEMATAVAGSVIGINPFDQPDVEAAKVMARELMSDYENGIDLPAHNPLASAGHLSLYAEPDYATELQPTTRAVASMVELLGAHLYRFEAGDYFGLLAYLNRNHKTCDKLLQVIRQRIRDHYHVASCLGYGPRYLHSTGQAYKGGPNSGVFLILTRDPLRDLSIPQRRISFGVVQTAQALADSEVLGLRGRRVVRLNLGADPVAGLQQLLQMLDAAFSFATSHHTGRARHSTVA
jgi:transaldolase/glucose-6-phosphate isomerase